MTEVSLTGKVLKGNARYFVHNIEILLTVLYE